MLRYVVGCAWSACSIVVQAVTYRGHTGQLWVHITVAHYVSMGCRGWQKPLPCTLPSTRHKPFEKHCMSSA